MFDESSRLERKNEATRTVQKNVASIESSVLSGLDDAYDGFSANALKEVRRILPVSGTKFNWAQVGAQKVMKAALTKK